MPDAVKCRLALLFLVPGLPAAAQPAAEWQPLALGTAAASAPFAATLPDVPLGEGSWSELALALIAHRLVGTGALQLDDPLSAHLPAALHTPVQRGGPRSVRDLLAAAGGFAYLPPGAVLADLSAHRVALRRPGRVASIDPFGWRLLAKLLEVVSNQPLEQLIRQQLCAPLGLDVDQVPLVDGLPQPLPAVRSTLLTLLATNQDAAGAPYLNQDGYQALVHTPSLQPHPLASGRTAGLKRRLIGSAYGLLLAADCVVLFPAPGLAYWLDPGLSGNCAEQLYKLAKSPPAEFSAPDGAGARAAAATLAPLTPFASRYVPADRPSRLLADRLYGILHGIDLRLAADGGLRVTGAGQPTRRYQPVAPLAYTDGAGGSAVFAPFDRAGYVELDGRLHRRAGLLSVPALVLWPVPAALVLLLSAGIYWRAAVAPDWRRLARIGSAAALLAGGGIAAELWLGGWALYRADIPLLMAFWRVLLNAGLALGLSAVLYALSIARRGLLPSGAGALLMPLHLALIAVAGLVLFLDLVAWGIAGSFWPG